MYNTLPNYYETIFALRQHHGYNDNDILEWIPYERDIYVEMLLNHLKLEKEKANKH